MKYFQFIFVTIFLSIHLSGQDQLFKKDNSKHEVKVLEVTPSEIKYKLKANPDGPLYIISKSDVALIIYSNGEHETFSESTTSKSTVIYNSPLAKFDTLFAHKKREQEKKFHELSVNKNIISINLVSAINSEIGLSFMREFANGWLLAELPVSFSFSEPTIQNVFGINSVNNYYYSEIYDFRITHKAFESGLGLYINTSGKRAITHLIGPQVKFAQYNGTYKVHDGVYPYISSNLISHGFVMNETYVMINNMLLFRITPHFNMMMNVSLGMSNRRFIANHPNTKGNNSNYYYPSVTSNFPILKFGFQLSYRF